MLTVLAIEESLMREIGDFEPLLQNVAKDGEYKICSWKREGKTLEESIPALFDREFISEGELLSWNILIVSDDRNCFSDNPFEGSYNSENSEEQLADKELNELAKMLGVVPTHSVINCVNAVDKSSSAHFDISVSNELQEQKLNEYKIADFTRPGRIYLMAVQKKYDVDIIDYSKKAKAPIEVNQSFSIKGCYPPNCRFLKFNLSSNSNRTTMSDYFRLWMTILSLAYNDGEDDLYIAPYVLYSVDTEIDKDEVGNQITDIYSRIHFVKKHTENQIEHIHKLREYQAEKHYDIPYLESSVVVSFESDEEGLYINKRKFGLAKNCPVQDEPEYKAQRETIEKNIKEYLKVPRRAVRKSVGKTKDEGKYIPDTAEFIHLNREQLEDLDESIDLLEIELMKADAIDVNYPKENAELRKAADKKTYKTMKMRSSVGAIILGSLAMFAAFILAFVPYIINAIRNVKTDEAIADSIMVTLICVILMAICGIITLFVLRIPLSGALRNFKKTIDSLVSFVKNQAEAYSEYLSKLSGFMKRNSFKRYLNSDKEAYMRAEEDLYVLNRNYCSELENTCKAWAEGLRFNLVYSESKANPVFTLDESPYTNPIYSFVVSNGEFNIDFNNSPSQLEVPYGFIKSLNINREEVRS